MPPRLVTLAILVFWLATFAWFCQHDLGPRLRPGQKPPYTIDLAQEVSGPNPRSWDVFYNGQTIGNASTWVYYDRDGDTYELTTKCWFNRFTFPLLDVQTLESRYTVTRDGDLREVNAAVTAVLHVGRPRDDADRAASTVTGKVHGVVENGTLAPLWTVDLHELGRYEFRSDPVEVASNHSVLSPLQPWNRLLDVQEDKRWRIELFDPLMDSVAHLLPGGARPAGVRELEAGVLQGTEDLSWNNVDVPCLVIEYRGEDVTGRTYVRKADGLVLRQELTRQDHRLTLERKPQ